MESIPEEHEVHHGPIEDLGQLSPPQDSDSEEEDSFLNQQAQKMVSLMNLFLQYYKQRYHLHPQTHMFEGLDHKKPTDTNHGMESFYEEIHKYQSSNEDHREVIHRDLKEEYRPLFQRLREIYSLSYDGQVEWYSGSLLCLLTLVQQKLVEQPDLSWQIFSWSLQEDNSETDPEESVPEPEPEIPVEEEELPPEHLKAEVDDETRAVESR